MTRAWTRTTSSPRLVATATTTAVAAVALALVGAPTLTDTVATTPPPVAAMTVAAPAGLTVQEAPAEPTGPQPMAEVAGARLVVPAADPAAVGFHQGGFSDLELSPTGDHVVMASRNRSTAPTSAVDVAVGRDRTVTSPVTGTVTQVAEYSLYGRVPDVLVTIEPDDAAVSVRMMHLTDVSIEPGDRVEAGESVARARQLPMGSQVDRHHDGPAGPHVHLDVSAR